jgi:hypothetical protein
MSSDDAQSQIGHVMIVFRAYDAATTSIIVERSWDATECLSVNETKIRESFE